ncbi:MAG: EAL domain-containing protein [Coriobacteriales bacterium]|jgi:lactose/cellobiose-specific phosphotransferase system IIC component|nr:EAL domain-containing protein [Coriobacteriales bacterium]
MIEAFGRLTGWLASSRIIRALTSGLISLIPLVLVGAIFLAILNLPLPWFQEFLDTAFAGRWLYIADMVDSATFEIIGLAALFTVSAALVAEEPRLYSGEINRIIPVLVAFCCYVVSYAFDAQGVLSIPHTDGSGIFYSLVTALISIKLFALYTRLWQRLPRRRSQLEADLRIRSAFRAIFPVLATILSFIILKMLASGLLNATDAMGQINAWIENNLVSDSYGSVLLTVLLCQLLWFFGIHGTDAVMGHFPSLLAGDVTGNIFATNEFYNTFIGVGGAGCGLGLLLALLVVGSHHRGQKLARASIFPAVFNVNETLLYGGPVVLNPFLFLPFILAPLLASVLSFLAVISGLVPPISSPVQWTTPPLISGWLSTGSASGAVLQLVILLASALIYAPFVLLNRNYESQQRARQFDALKVAALAAAEGDQAPLLTRHDDLGVSAREFVIELHEYFDSDNIPFHLVYQPKVNAEGQMVGAEALLRWQHPEHGHLSPVLLIEMTDEAQLANQLGRWLARTALQQYASWRKSGLGDFILSINLNPRHLAQDPDFADYLAGLIQEFQIHPGEIELEITEHLAMHSDAVTRALFGRLRALGFGLSIDDLGMGYSSLSYISDFGVETVKIDASLISEIQTDVQQREIVRSIVGLGQSLGLTVVVEGVETGEQLEALLQLGVRAFQGYYFSRPLSAEDFARYARAHGVEL